MSRRILFFFPSTRLINNLYHESQWVAQQQLQADNSSRPNQDNCPDFDLGINVPSEWFHLNGNYNFDLDLASVDWSKINNTSLDLGQDVIADYDSSNSLTPEDLHNIGDLDTWSCPSTQFVPISGPSYSPDQLALSGIQSQNESPSNCKTSPDIQTSASDILTSNTATLRWDGTMSATAHSDFFGPDLDLANNLTPCTVSAEVWAQAQENLSRWIDLDADPTSQLPESSPSDALPSFTYDGQLPANAHILSKSPSTQSSSSSFLDTDVTGARKLAPATNVPQTSSALTSVSNLTEPSTSKVTKSKQFHFVANSDKKTATRLRNTMTSRNLRQSKVSRIAQLEKELAEQLSKTEKWKARAVELGWEGKDGNAESC